MIAKFRLSLFLWLLHSKPLDPLVRHPMLAAVPVLLLVNICPFSLAVIPLPIVGIDADKSLFLPLHQAFDGTRIILAGGLKQTFNSTSNAVQSDVYSFDIATATWTKLNDAPAAFAYGVCAVSGDYLIVYGGYSEYTASVNGSIVYREDGSANGTIAYNNAISILNLKTNIWVDDYKPSAAPQSSAPQSSALSVFGGMKALMYSSALALSVVVSLL